MGHALEKAHQLLRSRGRLAEMHYSGRRPLVEVHQADQIFVAGEVTREDDFEEHREVSQVLDQTVSEGLFKPRSQQFYDYLIYADSLASLLEWRKENSKRSVIDDAVIKEAERMVSASAGPSLVVLRRPSRLALFEKV